MTKARSLSEIAIEEQNLRGEAARLAGDRAQRVKELENLDAAITAVRARHAAIVAESQACLAKTLTALGEPLPPTTPYPGPELTDAPIALGDPSRTVRCLDCNATISGTAHPECPRCHASPFEFQDIEAYVRPIPDGPTFQADPIA